MIARPVLKIASKLSKTGKAIDHWRARALHDAGGRVLISMGA
jgi:hypothetical protein